MPRIDAHSDTEWTVPADGEVWSHATVETNGVEVHAVTAGPEDGELVVLLHGFPEFWYAWHHQIPALARRATASSRPTCGGTTARRNSRGSTPTTSTNSSATSWG